MIDFELFFEIWFLGYGPEQAAPILQDFSNRWTASIEAMNKEVTMQFSGSSCGMDVLQVRMVIKVILTELHCIRHL